jgi:hypothetical protein
MHGTTRRRRVTRCERHIAGRFITWRIAALAVCSRRARHALVTRSSRARRALVARSSRARRALVARSSRVCC